MRRRNKIRLLFTVFVIYLTSGLYAQSVKLNVNAVEAVNVSVTSQKLGDENVLRVTKDSVVTEFDENTFARIKNIDFQDGTIQVKVLSRLLSNAPDFARGFIGVVFHVNKDNSMFESIYLRPTNGRADNQVQRNHSIQYFAYPDFKFQRLRKESPEMYESYADMTLDEWITIRIEIDGTKAKLFLNDNKQPSLIVNDLKLGGNKQGAIGLFVDVGTEGFFKDLSVTKR